ncbi:MAG: stage II sporulation protein D [Ruminococcaceae bacterium]|nr:stage II sporulation protein D [Oscillospiraceae bacterium]
MKNYLISIIFIFISLIITPVTILSSGITESKNVVSNNIQSENREEETTTISSGDTTTDTITVFLSDTKENLAVSEFEYVCGSVAAEMPLMYHEEALKAQAIACYTNSLRLKNSKNKSEINGADISDNPATHQGYLTREERKEKWGEDYQKYESKLETIVKEVEGEFLTYDGEYCLCAFSAICTGTTESAENVWGEKIPYLVSVKSSGDTLSPQYSSTNTFTKSQFISIMKDLDVSINSKANLKDITGKSKTSKAGTVLKIEINKKSLTGEQIRNAFSLRSSAFKITATENEVTFKVSGYGHGVGMSQYGADFMARQGSTYDEILKHYYKGAEIEK